MQQSGKKIKFALHCRASALARKICNTSHAPTAALQLLLLLQASQRDAVWCAARIVVWKTARASGKTGKYLVENFDSAHERRPPAKLLGCGAVILYVARLTAAR